MTKDAIINDLEKHLSDSVKQYYRDFYVGITNDENRCLFTDHNVDKDNDWWIYCKADSEEIARDVEKYYLEIGMKGDIGGGNPYKPNSTIQLLGLSAPAKKVELKTMLGENAAIMGEPRSLRNDN